MTTDHDLGVRILSGAPYKECDHNMNSQLKKNKSNFVPLTPLSFLYRTKNIFPKLQLGYMEKEKLHTMSFIIDVSR